MVLWHFMNFKCNDDTDNGLWAARLAAAVEQMSFGSKTIMMTMLLMVMMMIMVMMMMLLMMVMVFHHNDDDAFSVNLANFQTLLKFKTHFAEHTKTQQQQQTL